MGNRAYRFRRSPIKWLVSTAISASVHRKSNIASELAEAKSCALQRVMDEAMRTWSLKPKTKQSSFLNS